MIRITHPINPPPPLPYLPHFAIISSFENCGNLRNEAVQKNFEFDTPRVVRAPRTGLSMFYLLIPVHEW